MTVNMTWNDVARRLEDIGVSRAAFCRRANISESSFYNGLRAGEAVGPRVAGKVRVALHSYEQQVREAMGAAREVGP